MAWKLKYRCKRCGYEAEVYEGRGLFRQQITSIICSDCKTVQNIVVGGIIADVAPSYRSEVGRLCPKCGSEHIRIWNKRTCPKCQAMDLKDSADSTKKPLPQERSEEAEMEPTGEREFWT